MPKPAPADPSADNPVWEQRPNAENPTVVLACGCREGGVSDFYVVRLESRPDLDPPVWRRTWNPHAKRHADNSLLTDADNDHPTLDDACAAAARLYRQARTALTDRRQAGRKRDELAAKRTRCLRHRFQNEIDRLVRPQAA